MALPTDDGRVLCLSCKHITTNISRHMLVPTLAAMPQDVIALVLSLISTPAEGDVPPTYELVRIGQKGLGFHQPMTDADHARVALAAMQENTDVLLTEAERVEIALRCGPHALHTLRISYLPKDHQVAQQVTQKGVEGQFSSILDRLGKPEAFAFNQLLKLGFQPQLAGVDLESAMRRVPMIKGNAGGQGIRAEISWVA